MTATTAPDKLTVVATGSCDPRDIVLDESRNGRRYPAPVSDLIESLVEEGQINPVQVTEEPVEGRSRLVLANGFRRLKAALEIREQDPDYRIRYEVVAPQEPGVALARNMAENMSRENLRPMDHAYNVSRLLELGMTKADIARRFGQSPSWVSKHVALMRLPAGMQRAVQAGKVAGEAAYELAQEEDPDRREKLYRDLVAQSGSGGRVTKTAVRAAARRAREEAGGTTNLRRSIKEVREDWLRVAERGGSKRTPVEELASDIVRYVDGQLSFRTVLNRLAEAVGVK